MNKSVIQTNKKPKHFLATLLLSLLWLKAKAVGLIELMIYIVIFAAVIAGFIYVFSVIVGAIHRIFPEPPPQTNNVVYYYDTEWVNPPSGIAQPLLPMADISSVGFPIQYGLCSTNPTPALWLVTGNNVIDTNNVYQGGHIMNNSAFGTVWTLENDSNRWEIIHMANGTAFHMITVFSNYPDGSFTNITSDTNLNFYVQSSTNLIDWVNVHTDQVVWFDTPYTFTDTNPTVPLRFYRVVGN